jgi:hypothetical protein
LWRLNCRFQPFGWLLKTVVMKNPTSNIRRKRSVWNVVLGTIKQFA